MGFRVCPWLGGFSAALAGRRRCKFAHASVLSLLEGRKSPGSPVNIWKACADPPRGLCDHIDSIWGENLFQCSVHHTQHLTHTGKCVSTCHSLLWVQNSQLSVVWSSATYSFNLLQILWCKMQLSCANIKNGRFSKGVWKRHRTL